MVKCQCDPTRELSSHSCPPVKRLPYPSVYRRQGYGRIAPTVDSPRRRAGIKSSTRRGLVQPTSKGWLNPIHGLRVIGANGSPTMDDGKANRQQCAHAERQGDLLPSDPHFLRTQVMVK